MARRVSFASLVLLALAVTAGCATHRPTTLADRFISRAEPAADEPAPEPVAPAGPTLEEYVAALRRLTAAGPRPARAPLPTVETTDPDLRLAVLRVAASPTAEHHRLAGDAYRRAGVLDAAHEHLTRAATLNPTDAAAHDGLARIWRDWGFAPLGLGAAHRAVHYAPASPEVHNTLGTLLQAVGRRREARQAYERSLTLDPRAFYALNNLCYVLMLEGENNAARAACSEALRVVPTLTAARNNLGLVYAAAGDLAAAEEQFLAAGDAASAHYNLGIVHLARRQFRKAARAFQAAYAARPSLAAARARARQADRLAGAAAQDEPNHPRD